jgi:heterodisulfide reductase subunit A
MEETRIGVFVCHCGTNIGGSLDVPKLREYAETLPGVVYAEDNLYTCSETGLRQIKNGIKEHNLNRVVVASCTPRTHEPTFRSACKEAGLNPFLFEFVNIREQCSWVHMKDKEKAQEKAKDLIRMGVAKSTYLQPLEEITTEVKPESLVIGGGIAGMSAALALGRIGFKVWLIEKEEHLGGMLRYIYKLYPGNIDASLVLEDRTKEINENPNIQVLTSSEVTEVQGFIGNYTVTIKKSNEEKKIDVGTIIVATGANLFIPEGMYGYNGKNVITHLDLEQTLKEKKLDAKKIVMIQCVGSRIPERDYCSKICCMNSIKNALLIKENYPDASVSIIYRDMQTYGTRYEQYYSEARKKGVMFIRYDLDKAPEVDEKTVKVYDQLLGKELELPYDLLVLSTPLQPDKKVEKLGQILRVPVDKNLFFLEAHVKLRPIDFATDGIFIAGCARGPVDFGESISQGYGAASRASIPMTNKSVTVEPIISQVDENICRGCGRCVEVCEYHAPELVKLESGQTVSRINSAVCKGCGTCCAACPSGAITALHFTDAQIEAMIAASSTKDFLEKKPKGDKK